MGCPSAVTMMTGIWQSGDFIASAFQNDLENGNQLKVVLYIDQILCVGQVTVSSGMCVWMTAIPFGVSVNRPVYGFMSIRNVTFYLLSFEHNLP
jgi:hypothetical protein